VRKFLLVNDTIKSKNLGCQLVSYCLRQSFDDPFDSVFLVNTKEKNKDYNIKDYSFVYINGEGSMAGRNNSFSKYCKQALKNKTPLFFNNMTFDPLKNKSFIKSWKSTLLNCKTVCVREPLSYYYLQNKGIEKAKLFPDIGVTYGGEFEEKKDLICFGGGSINKRHSVTKDNIKAFHKIFEAFKDYELVFLDWPSSVSDHEYLRKVLTKDVEVIKPNFKQYWEIVSKAKLNVTGRHHGCVMSFTAETPFITFSSNMWKTAGDSLFYRDTLDNYFQKMPNSKNVDLVIQRMEYELDNNDFEINKLKEKKAILIPHRDSQVKIVTEELGCNSTFLSEKTKEKCLKFLNDKEVL